jgi:nucleoside-diphosphate-sugar epimerase
VKILVTGATGFIGRQACRELTASGHEVTATARTVGRAVGIDAARIVVTGPVTPETDWSEALAGVEAVLHLLSPYVAGDGFAPGETDPARQMIETARALTQQAAGANVLRLVHTSSIKASGEATTHTPFGPENLGDPVSEYGKAKRDTELAIAEASAGTQMSTVSVRPPVVYGPGEHGSIRRLIGLLSDKPGWMLPLNVKTNRRSFIYVGNLVSALIACLKVPGEGHRTIFIQDERAVSTAELSGAILRALGRSEQLGLTPPAWLGRHLGGVGRRLYGSLEIDDSLCRLELGWRPAVTLDEAMSAAVAAFREEAA